MPPLNADPLFKIANTYHPTLVTMRDIVPRLNRNTNIELAIASRHAITCTIYAIDDQAWLERCTTTLAPMRIVRAIDYQALLEEGTTTNFHAIFSAARFEQCTTVLLSMYTRLGPSGCIVMI